MPQNDHVTLITGAGGYLGSAIAAAVAERGSAVVLVDVDAAALEHAKERLGGHASRVLSLVADVGSDLEAEGIVQRAVAELGHIDCCVNNAGAEGPVCPTADLDMQQVLDLYQVNVFGVLRVIKAVLPHFKERKSGRIINMASGSGLSGTAYMAAYNSSKHAVVGLTRCVALEVAPDNISVNAVCPGCVESPMMRRIETAMARLTGGSGSFAAAIPATRYAQVTEVANLVAYLALEAPTYMTGAALVIDGGLNA
jgi:meso-butanediol dehydrogenase / (S,S)-butanediol dehydrogenase / diacetyl reductase